MSANAQIINLVYHQTFDQDCFEFLRRYPKHVTQFYLFSILLLNFLGRPLLLHQDVWIVISLLMFLNDDQIFYLLILIACSWTQTVCFLIQNPYFSILTAYFCHQTFPKKDFFLNQTLLSFLTLIQAQEQTSISYLLQSGQVSK